MTELIIQNCYSWLKTDEEKIKDVLWNSLRFREKNYFHSRLYKARLWDGFTEFYNKDSGKFLTGLLIEVETALKLLNIEYIITDQRKEIKFLYNEIDENFLNKWLPAGEQKIIMRDYQVSYVNSILQYKRGLVSSKTGSGKTNIAVAFLKCVPENIPTLIFSNTANIVDQNYQEMIKWGIKNVGRVYGKYFEPNIFTCATVQSLHKIQDLLPFIKVMVGDEIHLLMSKKPKTYYNKMKECSVRVGLSATPFKFGGSDKCSKYRVKGYFGPILKVDSQYAEDGLITTERLQEHGILSKSKCIFYPINTPDLKYAIYSDAIDRGISNNFELHDIVRKLVLLKCSGRTLILVDRIETGDLLNKLIPGSLWVQGKDNLETRKFVIEKLQNSKEDVVGIATTGIFSAGINIFIQNLINCSDAVAEHLILQRIGRGLRPASDKDILKYYDFYYYNNEYLEAHSKKRVKVLKDEGHDVEVKEEIDFI